MQQVLKEALKRIKPSKEEEREVKKIAKEIISKIKIKDAKAEMGGSGKKGTWLKGMHDIDIYVKFNPKKYKNEEISEILRKELKSKFGKIDILHGSRNYYQIHKGDYTIELIPIMDIKKVEDHQNITDVSPFHAKWVLKHKKSDEIRLAKSFCKAQNCYGAESYIQGFSGYVLEILTIHYGSFEKLVKEVSKWKRKVFLDPQNHRTKLARSKTQSPLVLIDPVQPDRNAAAALGRKKFNRFIQACQKFLKNPTIHAFEKKEVTISELKRRAKDKKLILLQVRPLSGKTDVIGAKLVKVLRYIRKQLMIHDFKIYDYNWKWNKKYKALLWFIIGDEILPKFKEHEGPKIKQKKHVINFKKKNRNYIVYEKHGRIFSKVPRRFREPKKLVKKLLKDGNITKRVKNICLLQEKS